LGISGNAARAGDPSSFDAMLLERLEIRFFKKNEVMNLV